MDSFFARLKNPLVLIAIVLLQVLALAVQVQRPATSGPLPAGAEADTSKVSLLRHWAVFLITPVERLVHGTSLGVRHAWGNYVDLRHTREQNAQLRADLARLRLEQAAFAEDAAQGRRLQALLAFKQQYVTATVAAQVIGTSGVDRSGLVYIDKGSADGLQPGMAVMTPDGVVGKLRDVWGHTAQLLLLNDPTSGAGVVLVSTRMRGILRGTANGAVQINNLTPDDRIKPGEQIITSGGDRVYPRGLPVGVIESIVRDPQHQPYTAITIKPAANLRRLEEVLVITATDSNLPAAAQSDAATAEATASETKRAADLIAERLPTLHGPDAKPAQGSTGATIPAVSEKPRPLPTLRPDRYSPGTTPSAQELQPGARSPPQP